MADLLSNTEDIMSDEREEGEISDLDLEDVSDCSISVGKSPPSNCKALDLTFSSISENEDALPIRCTHCRRDHCGGVKCIRRSKRKRSKRERIVIDKRVVIRNDICSRKDNSLKHVHKQKTIVIDTSSSETDDDLPDLSLTRKLNKAVRVNTSVNLNRHQTSLKTRLKNMIGETINKSRDNSSDSEYDLNELRQLALMSKQKEEKSNVSSKVETPDISSDSIQEKSAEPMNSALTASETDLGGTAVANLCEDDEDDPDLLRLRALRSAVIKKHKARMEKNSGENIKKRKTEVSDYDIDSFIEEVLYLHSESFDTNNEKEERTCSTESDEHSKEASTEITKNISEHVLCENMLPSKSVLLESSPDKSSVVQQNETLCENGDNTTNDDNLYEKKILPIESVQDNKKGLLDVKTDKTNMEEDEDILRAICLSAISKKYVLGNQIAAASSNEKKIDLDKIQQSVINKEKTTMKKNRYSSPVQPLVINIGNDSDSDPCDEVKSPVKPKISPEFAKKVSDFLNEQRAKVEWEQQRAKVENVIPDAMKRLPESSQAEYLRLKERLDILNKLKFQASDSTDTLNELSKKISRKKSFSKEINKSVLKKNSNFKNYKITNNIKQKILKENLINKNQLVFSKNTAKKLLEQTLLDRQTSQKRFLEGKFRDLAPIVKESKAARIARDKAEIEVKRLIEELHVARKKYAECHQKFKNCVNRYLTMKAAIESQESHPVSELPAAKLPANSGKPKEIKINTAQDIGPVVTNKEIKTEIIDKSSPTIEARKKEISQPIAESTPKGVFVNKRHLNDDNVFAVLCPFSLQGECRDPECEYRHPIITTPTTST